MIPNVGPLELIIVLVIALIVLGPKKLPEFGRSVGRGMREFKGALTGESSDRAERDDEDDRAYRAGIDSTRQA
jgi:sec-independent protein translocase protein TatA